MSFPKHLDFSFFFWFGVESYLWIHFFFQSFPFAGSLALDHDAYVPGDDKGGVLGERAAEPSPQCLVVQVDEHIFVSNSTIIQKNKLCQHPISFRRYKEHERINSVLSQLVKTPVGILRLWWNSTERSSDRFSVRNAAAKC